MQGMETAVHRHRPAVREALVDKVVMVTGVANGCGKVLAEAFAADGAEVVGCDTNVDAGRATAAAVRAAGGEMTFVEADVADDAAMEALVARTVQTCGGLDCAVNNAGTEATGLIADSDDEVFDRQHVLGHQ
jgi:NAD(P)-dependent dehydrogenase (short-subunit alcohol dehydrogenase family)